MELLKRTKDDPNFQQHLKERINYAMDRAQKCKTYVSTQMQNKHQAGYYNQNVDKDAFNYLKMVMGGGATEDVPV